MAIAGLAGCGSSSTSKTSTLSSPTKAASTIAESALPAEARAVIRRIDAGGPFQHRQDGVTFQNRERLLPKQPSGYYREYTVDTPGAEDRGARRLVAGRQGELYYTPDHYRSFLRVVRGGAS
ncbi:MAG: ribonuclease N [Catenulispora sp.]|nr:ribonuclease N [Catenulispora sp.]